MFCSSNANVKCAHTMLSTLFKKRIKSMKLLDYSIVWSLLKYKFLLFR